MEELRLSLIALGALAIGGILIHGLWTIRKNNNSKSARNEFLPHDEEGESDDPIEPSLNDGDWQTDDVEDIDPIDLPASSDYDELGLGQVRVVSHGPSDSKQGTSEMSEPVEPKIDLSESIDADSPPTGASSNDSAASSVSASTNTAATLGAEAMHSSAASAGQWASSDIPEPPPSLLRKASVASSASVAPSSKAAGDSSQSKAATKPAANAKAEKPSLAAQAKNLVSGKKPAARGKRKEPKVDEEQMSIDFGMEGAGNEREPAKTKVNKPAKKASNAAASAPTASKGSSSEDSVQQEVLVINLKAKDGQDVAGSALLPMLLTLGLKFGDQDVFHRHVNPNGTGPVLFSLANMFKPGTFDIDNMETFKTQGLSLFMIMPTQTDSQQVFQMMHNAARKLSEEFALSMLDGRRSTLTKQSVQQYVEKIREFERKRMLQRS